MPSNSFIRFKDRLDELSYLRDLASDRRLRPIRESQRQIYLHSYLAGVVAAWDAYINSLIDEYIVEISNPGDIRFSHVYSLLRVFAKRALDKFNTPNFENTRNLLILTTGYDPISDWVWLRRGFNARATQDRINEILKVRHSFAHGFSMPSYSWNRSSSGIVRLTIGIVRDIEQLFLFIAIRTDEGVASIIRNTHGRAIAW